MPFEIASRLDEMPHPIEYLLHVFLEVVHIWHDCVRVALRLNQKSGVRVHPFLRRPPPTRWQHGTCTVCVVVTGYPYGTR